MAGRHARLIKELLGLAIPSRDIGFVTHDALR